MAMFTQPLIRRRAEQIKLPCAAVLGFDPRSHVPQMNCTRKGKQVAPEFRALQCHCHEGMRQGCARVLACVSWSRHRAPCCTWGRGFGGSLLSLCHHGSHLLHLEQTAPNTPYPHHPPEHSQGQPAGAAKC